MRVTRRWATASMAALPALSVVVWSAGCTWLVAFDTLPCDGGSCLDGRAPLDSGSLTVDSAPIDAPRDSAVLLDSRTQDVVTPDVIATDTLVATDTSTPPDVVPPVDSAIVDVVTPPDTTTPPDTGTGDPCTGQQDGYSWNIFDAYARCCGGVAVETTTDTNCGVCGITCNTDLGQTCGLIDSEYLCLNCQANADCWSGCCAGTVSPPHCGANTCASGMCSAAADPCTPYGATCNFSGVWYCGYP